MKPNRIIQNVPKASAALGLALTLSLVMPCRAEPGGGADEAALRADAHGGIHRGEKRTLMLVSGPGVNPGGVLSARGIDGEIHYPTLLDMTPTALAWLGYPHDGLESFARDGFAEYLVDWNRAQREDILDQLGGVDDVQRALDEAGFSDLRIEKFRGRLERLLQFVALSGDARVNDALELPDYTHFRTDGNVLVLNQ